MANEELIFILNTAELKDGGFDGSFNDFAEELEDTGATVSGEYDENGVPVMTVYGISQEDINNLLMDYGVDSPEEYTSDIEEADEFDFDLDGSEDDIEDEIEIVDEEDEDDDDEEDGSEEIEDDDDFIIDDDEDEDEDDDEDDDEIDEDEMERFESRRRRVSQRPRFTHKVVESDNVRKNWKGTANVSESVTRKILAEAIDQAIAGRIIDDLKFDEKMRRVNETYKAPIPFAGIKVDGKEIIMMSESEIQKTLKVAKSGLKKGYMQYKSLNESQNGLKTKYAKVIKKQKKLVSILENILAFKSGRLFEEEENDGQLATLTAITFKVKNADDFIKVLTDHGIPSEALEKVEFDENKEGMESNDTQESPQESNTQSDTMGGGTASQGNNMGGNAGSGNPFESFNTRLSNRLNEEDENPFGDTDQPSEYSGIDPLNTESHDNNVEGEEVRLVDTSYAKKVQEILSDVYGISKEQFDDKLGGSIEDGEDETGSDETGSDAFDENGNQTEEDAKKVGNEETIDPSDVFGDL